MDGADTGAAVMDGADAGTEVMDGADTGTAVMDGADTGAAVMDGAVKGGPVGAGGDPVLLNLDGGGTLGDDAGSGRSKVEEVSTDSEHHERGNCSLFLICISVY